MQHYFWDVYGWFPPSDGEAYKQMVELAKDGAHFVEVGSFAGRSSCFMAVEIINSGKQIKFDCVDTWLGSIAHQVGQRSEYHSVANGTLFEEFKENMVPVAGYYNAVRLPSVDAAKTYANNSLDFVFIDADHEYESVKEDIKAWFPKVKVGGILAGHDYAGPWWPGVAKAVHELPGAGPWPGTACWKYIKNS